MISYGTLNDLGNGIFGGANDLSSLGQAENSGNSSSSQIQTFISNLIANTGSLISGAGQALSEAALSGAAAITGAGTVASIGANGVQAQQNLSNMAALEASGLRETDPDAYNAQMQAYQSQAVSNQGTLISLEGTLISILSSGPFGPIVALAGLLIQNQVHFNPNTFNQILNSLAAQFFNSGDDDPPGGAAPANGGGGGAGRDANNLFNNGDGQIDPIVLDLTGQGINLTALNSSGTYFDFTGDGFAQQTSWVGPGNGILSLDPTGANISNGTQLIDSFAQLQQLAGGVQTLDASNPIFQELRVWVPADGVGNIAGTGQLFSLAELGITSINLDATSTDVSVAGNTVNAVSTFSLSDGTSLEVAAVSLQQNPSDTVPDTPISIPSQIAALPQVGGAGMMLDLRSEMTEDPVLAQMVQNFVALPAGTNISLIESDVQSIMFQWAGVENVAPGSRGTHVDARQLEFVEAYLGQPFNGAYGSDPVFHSAPDVDAAWNDLFNSVLTQLVLQSPSAASLLPEFTYDAQSGIVTPVNNLQSLQATYSRIGTPTEGNMGQWDLALRAFDAFRLELGLSTTDYEAIVTAFTSDTIGSLANAVASNLQVSIDQNGNITETGTPLNDVFYAGQGIVKAIGGGGGETYDDPQPLFDTFVFNSGDGAFEIDEADTLATIGGASNVLQLGSGITASELTVTATADGTGLVLTDGTVGDRITIDDMLGTAVQGMPGIEKVEFADGTTISSTQLVDLETLGTSGNDTLYGGATGGNLFDGKGGHDLELGHGNGDTFVFDPGYGQLEINETDSAALYQVGGLTANPPNILQLGAGITAASLTVTATADGTGLVLTDGTVGDRITIDNMLEQGSANPGIEEIEFADGSTLSAAQLIALETTGTSGNDKLYGFAAGGNLFDGRGGNDLEVGHGNGDTFVFDQGYGHLEINESDDSSNPDNILEFGAGITAASLTAVATSDGTGLILTDGTTGDQITIDNMLTSPEYGTTPGIEEIEFADGTTMSSTQLIDIETSGTGGNDTLYGGVSGGNLFDGKGGDDLAIGNGNGDTFVFDQGYGHLEINETGSRADGSSGPNLNTNNVLQMGGGITASSLVVAAAADGTGLILTDGTQGDQITIDNMLRTGNGATTGIEEVEFADGTTLSVAQLVALETTGTSGNDTLYGGVSGGNLFDGKGGNDVEVSNGPADTFVFDQGYGHLQIEEYDYSSDPDPGNVLQLGAGITAASLTAKADASGLDLVLTDGVTGDQITIDGMLTGFPDYLPNEPLTPGIQEVEFADGTTMSGAQLIALETIGTSGNDRLYGGGSDGNLFDGKGGNDFESGTGGGDTFVFNQGYGQLEILEGGTTGTNVLQLGAGITESSLAISESADGKSIILTDGTAGDVITLDNMWSGSIDGIQEIEFADGTSMSRQQLLQGLTIGTSGNDTLSGNVAGGSLFDGKGGDDLEIGYGRGDTFVFNQDYGKLEISENDNSADPDNVLQLGTGITAASLTVKTGANGKSLVLTDGIAGDQITIDNMLMSPEYGTTPGIEEIEFADGTTMSSTQLIDIETSGTSGKDTLYGGVSGGNLFDGKGGGDLEIGNGNGDTFVFNQGYGKLEIDENDLGAAPDNVLQLGAGITAASLTVRAATNGTGLVLTDGTAGDQITIDNMLSPDYGSGLAGIEEIKFADSTTMSAAQLLDLETIGTTGNDNLVGSANGGSLFDGKGGNDLETGYGNGDTFVFNQGYGHLEIRESNDLGSDTSAPNILQLGAGLTASSLTVKATADGTGLILTDGTAGDQITIDNMLTTGIVSRGIEVVEFADGTTMSAAQLVALETTGTSGNDTLYGGEYGGNLFDGKGGKDLEVGTGNGDTFVFNQGYGQLEINETDSSYFYDINAGRSANPVNTLQLGAGITASSLTATATANGTGLILTDGTLGDQITIENMLTGNGYLGIEQVEFADGSTMSAAQLVDLETTGTSGHDVLYGGATGGNLFDGKGGNDVEIGNGGDTFVFNAGYGNLEIEETNTGGNPNNSVLQLGAGITAGSLTVKAAADGTDLILTDGVAGDQITIENMLAPLSFESSSQGIQEIEFSDGTTLSLAQLMQLETTGTTGNDTLYGTAAADLFDGKGGNDVEIGYGGNDTFVFNQGYGKLEIQESDPNSSPDNVLRLGAGITAASLTVTATQDGTGLVLSDGTPGDQITIDNMLGTGDFYSTPGIEEVEFADGTTMSAAQLVALETTGTSGNDTLYGSVTGGNLFDGKGGNDLEIANIGNQFVSDGRNDTFVFDQGYGKLEIQASDASDNPENVLQFGAGITAGSLTITATSNDTGLIITDGTTGDQITIDNLLAPTGPNSPLPGIEEVEFADGTTLSAAQLVDMETTGTSGNDTLYGGAMGGTLFNGEGGNDVEIASGDRDPNRNGDTFVFDQGYGKLEINELDSSFDPNNILRLGGGITAASLTATATADGTGIILTDGTTGDEITIDNMLTSRLTWNSPTGGIEKVVFDDGSSMSAAQLVDLATTGTSGNDTLHGGVTGGNLFDGKGGNDVEYGNGNGDTFVFNQGYGSLEISESDAHYDPNNVLQLGIGITEASLLVRASTDGTSLILTDGTAGDQIKIDNMLTPGNGKTPGIEEIEFADGTTMSAAQLVDLATSSKSGSGTLYGGATGGNLFNGQGGNDLEIGNGNGDTFVFDQGYGHLEINENDTNYYPDDVLQLGTGITAASLTVTATSNGTGLVLTDGTAGDQITVDNMLAQPTYDGITPGIDEVEFADGTTLSAAQLVDLETTGTSGNDTMYGVVSGGNLFDGKGGNDVEYGNGNGDTFVFNQGYGHLEINEIDQYGGGANMVNVLLLGPGITAASLTVQAKSDGTGLVLTDGIAGDEITLDNMLVPNAESGMGGIQEVQFADGTTMSAAQLVQQEIAGGTTGADVLAGMTDTADLLDGKGGNDLTIGNGGNDTFVFDQGYGNLEIDEVNNGFTANQLSVLQLGAGITASVLTATASADGTNLILTDGTAGDQITLDGMLAPNNRVGASGIQEVEFADGTTMSAAQLVDLETTGTSGNDTLYGAGAGGNLFDGKGGNDLEIGNGNGDTFVFNQGYGHLEINETDAASSYPTVNNVLQLGTGITATSLNVTATAHGTGLVLTDGIAGDQITLDNIQGPNATGIQGVEFADGTTLSAEQLIAMSSVATGTITGTPGADTLTATSGPDVFDGEGGNDLAIGSGGSDTFVFNQGYGDLEIRENYASGATPILSFGPGITTSSLSAMIGANGALTLRDGIAGDQITLDSMAAQLGWGVAQVDFLDGSTLTAQQLLAMATPITGTTGADTLTGTALGDVFDGKGGTDTEIGGGGNDTYLLQPNYGALTIENGIASSNVANGTLSILNESPDDIWLKQVGNDLQVDVMGTSTEATIQGWFSNGYSQLNSITTTDTSGTKSVLDTQLSQLIQAMATYSAQNPGFDPTSTANSSITDPALLALVNSSYHH